MLTIVGQRKTPLQRKPQAGQSLLVGYRGAVDVAPAVTNYIGGRPRESSDARRLQRFVVLDDDFAMSGSSSPRRSAR
jgi:hypothetical protein